MGSWKTAWKAARKLAGAILKDDPDYTAAAPLVCCTHDLRHSAISRMINAGTPLPKAAKIVGWSPSTMVKMAARYGHFTADDLRDAMEQFRQGPRYFPRYTPIRRELSWNKSFKIWLLR
jgi:integrase